MQRLRLDIAVSIIVAILLTAAVKTVWGQSFGHEPPQPPPPMVIDPADADAFRELIETTIPPRYNGALIRWYTAILQRQQAKAAAEAKAREEVAPKP